MKRGGHRPRLEQRTRLFCNAKSLTRACVNRHNHPATSTHSPTTPPLLPTQQYHVPGALSTPDTGISHSTCTPNRSTSTAPLVPRASSAVATSAAGPPLRTARRRGPAAPRLRPSAHPEQLRHRHTQTPADEPQAARLGRPNSWRPAAAASCAGHACRVPAPPQRPLRQRHGHVHAHASRGGHGGAVHRRVVCARALQRQQRACGGRSLCDPRIAGERRREAQGGCLPSMGGWEVHQGSARKRRRTGKQAQKRQERSKWSRTERERRGCCAAPCCCQSPYMHP